MGNVVSAVRTGSSVLRTPAAALLAWYLLRNTGLRTALFSLAISTRAARWVLAKMDSLQFLRRQSSFLHHWVTFWVTFWTFVDLNVLVFWLSHRTSRYASKPFSLLSVTPKPVSAASLRLVQHRRVAVIGAGPAGASAAHHLARLGIRVTLFEKDRVVGGRTHTHREAFDDHVSGSGGGAASSDSDGERGSGSPAPTAAAPRRGVQIDTGAGLFTQHYPLLQHLLPRLGLDRDLGVCGGQTYTLVDPGSGPDEPRGAQLEFGSLRSLLRLPLRGLSFLSKIRFLIVAAQQAVRRPAFDLVDPIVMAQFDQPKKTAAQDAVFCVGRSAHEWLVRPGLESFFFFRTADASTALYRALTAHASHSEVYTLARGMDTIARALLDQEVLQRAHRQDQFAQKQGLRALGGRGGRLPGQGGDEQAPARPKSPGRIDVRLGAAAEVLLRCDSGRLRVVTGGEKGARGLHGGGGTEISDSEDEEAAALARQLRRQQRLQQGRSGDGSGGGGGSFGDSDDGKSGDGDDDSLEFDDVVVACPAPIALRLVRNLSEELVPTPQREFLASQPYAASVHGVYLVRRSQLTSPLLRQRPEGKVWAEEPTGSILPAGPGNCAVAAVCFASVKHDRVPSHWLPRPGPDGRTITLPDTQPLLLPDDCEAVSVYLSDAASRKFMATIASDEARRKGEEELKQLGAAAPASLRASAASEDGHDGSGGDGSGGGDEQQQQQRPSSQQLAADKVWALGCQLSGACLPDFYERCVGVWCRPLAVPVPTPGRYQLAADFLRRQRQLCKAACAEDAAAAVSGSAAGAGSGPAGSARVSPKAEWKSLTTSASSARLEQPPSQAPRSARVVFAGDYLATATVEGALRSGLWAAESLLGVL